MGNRIEELLKRIDKRYKIAFLSTFVIGMLTHMYAFTNQVQNHDYYSNVHIDQFWWPLSLGRCFLWPFTTISSFFSIPWVLGLLSMLYLSIALCVIISVFDIKRYTAIILCGTVFVTHPAITDLIGYLFTMDGYCVGILFACIGVWFFEKKEGKKRIVGFVLMATLAIGIYQANLSFIIYLVCIKAILEIYTSKKVDKTFWKKYLTYVLLIIVSFALYFLCLKVMQSMLGAQMASYAGFNTASLPTFGYFVSVLWKDAAEFIHRFVGSDFEFTAYEILNIIFALGFLITNVKVIVKEKIYKSFSTLLTIIMLMIVLVYSTSIFDFATNALWYRWEMMQCVPLWYVLFIILIDRYLVGVFQSACAITVGMISFNFFLIANITYLNQELAFQQTYEQSSFVLNRILSLDDYSKDMPIYIIGEYQEERRDWLLDKIPENMTVDTIIMQDFLSVAYYNMGVSFSLADELEIEKVKNTIDVEKMPSWPEKGSVESVNGVIVVKFSD